MNCKKCGAEIEEDTIFCPACGSYVELRKRDNAVSGKDSAGRPVQDGGAGDAGKSVQDGEAGAAGEPAWDNTVRQDDTYTGAESQGGYVAGTQPGGGADSTGRDGGINSQYQYFDWKAASQTSAGKALEKPGKSKAPFIAMGVIGVAIAVTLVYLVVSLTSAGKAKDYVEQAIKNTFLELEQENEYSALIEEIIGGDSYTQELSATLTELSLSQYGMSTDLLEGLSPAEISLKAAVDRPDSCSKLEITGGAGDMKPILIEAFLPLNDAEGEMLIGLSGLYDRYIKMSLEDMGDLSGQDFDIEAGVYTHVDGRDEAGKALAETLVEWLQDAYEDVECRSTKKVKVDTGNGMLETKEYELSLSNKNYEKHLNRLPEMIRKNSTFMGWLTDMTTESDAEDFIDMIEDAVDESLFSSRVSKVVLCYVRIYQDKAIQISIPCDSEEDHMEGDVVVSFFGKENIGDDLQIHMDIKDGSDTVKADYQAVKDGSKSKISFSMDMAGEMEMEFLLDGEYIAADGRYTYQLNDLSFLMSTGNYLGESLGINLGLTGSYTIAEGADVAMPDADSAVSLMDMRDEEIQEMVVTVIENASRGGYVPSKYADQFAAYVIGVRAGVESQRNPGDNGGGSLDGSENMTFEEFAAGVKEIYGDIYTDEELRQIYDGMYDASFYDTDVVYGRSGNPYLYCDEGDLILELRGVDGFEIDEDYSSKYELFFVKEIGDEDEILIDYFITAENMEEYMEYQSDYQRNYYTEAGYTKVDIGDVRHGMIGGHQAAWLEYEASDTYGNRASGIIAFAQIDEIHGCVLDMYSLFGTEEVSEELLMKCFETYLIEN